ncbi:zf-HC2 domain-containing protein [Marinobacter sp. CHS3-4]|uniref:anti-sigma factor family protein n=1 Tax=Marinobacter sp. CHS3-4 TaxID=3045174 RepID=UPI0024B5FE78|nr:zf-HC2 domain-containing protein [Marinobacter sp. CHS3-4]MDI9246597.1 zf-HC2 domain-containing protein [Marinobacter sp. CHS3-4]
MPCSTCRKNMRAWLRGALSGDEALEVERHISDCYFCAVLVEKESALLDALQTRYRVPEPSADFRERVMAAATAQPVKKSPQAFGLPVLGGAIAAALAVGIAVGIGVGSGPTQEAAPALAASDGQVEQLEKSESAGQQTVRLAFNTAQAMKDVTLTVELPPHVEVSGYAGYHQLSWNVSLDQGENIVKLPLNVLFPGEGQLVARLNDGEREKVFRTQLNQTDVPGSPESAL